MEIVINEYDLKLSDIQEVSSKVRAFLIDENDNLLVANYHNVILLPGGKIDKDETIFNAINRELSEEIGQCYTEEELDFLLTLKYYQKDYPKGDDIKVNRLLITHYFTGKYKEINRDFQKLTEREKNGNFKLELVPLSELENYILNNKNDNPRNVYFQNELLIVNSYFRCFKNNENVKILK